MRNPPHPRRPDPIPRTPAPIRPSLERGGAALALGEVRGDATQVVPALAKALVSSNVILRRVAVRSLARYGKDATSAIPQLEKALEDEDPTVRSLAQDALKGLR